LGNKDSRLVDEVHLLQVAGTLAAALPCGHGLMVYLQGDLGAGKTTFVRGLLRALGHQGAVKSPTYTLLETYQVGQQRVHHIDLYRLTSPEEVEFLGFDELDQEHDWTLIEWPQMGLGFLPDCDLLIALEIEGLNRRLTLSAQSAIGVEIVKKIQP